jgi:hypothetical protein
MSGIVDPGADPLARLIGGRSMRCECGGWGQVTDQAEMDGGLTLVTWATGHVQGCPAEAWPERTFLLSAEATAAGDRALPWLPPEAARRRWRYDPPPMDWPLLPTAPLGPCLDCQPDSRSAAATLWCDRHRCAAWAPTTGQRCRNRVYQDGLCGTHHKQYRSRP